MFIMSTAKNSSWQPKGVSERDSTQYCWSKELAAMMLFLLFRTSMSRIVSACTDCDQEKKTCSSSILHSRYVSDDLITDQKEVSVRAVGDIQDLLGSS